MKKRKLRMYEAIWIQIRDTGYCKVAAVAKYHHRIRKAVYKEKDLDVGYKTLQELEDREKRMRIVMHPTYIEFFLVSKLNCLGDL